MFRLWGNNLLDISSQPPPPRYTSLAEQTPLTSSSLVVVEVVEVVVVLVEVVVVVVVEVVVVVVVVVMVVEVVEVVEVVVGEVVEAVVVCGVVCLSRTNIGLLFTVQA